MSNSIEPWKQKVDLFRRRFNSRGDVFSVKWNKEVIKTDPVTNETKTEKTSGTAPQCENFWKETLCLIRENRGGCAGCPNKKYAHLSDEWLWKHISGQKELVLFLVQEKGIRFGACDFDRGNPFADAKLCKDYSVKTLGLPCYIARSSKKGYHLYWFFSDFVEAHLFTSTVRRIFKDVGILERSLNDPEILVPEVFPKQTVYQDNKIGNGIKVPMIEPKMKEGFNCWVDDEAKPIPFEQQWKYFNECSEVTLERLNEVIEEHRIDILSRPVARSGAGAARQVQEGEHHLADSTHPRVLRGDFNKVIENCAALRQFWDKTEAGLYKFDSEIDKSGKGVPHVARLPAMLLALQTKNGEEMLLERWPSEKTRTNIEQAKYQKYSPATCQHMQENGVCKIGKHPKFGDHCLKRQPPVMIVGGEKYTNPDQLPETQWPSPSPIRFATQGEKLTCEQIIQRLNELFADTDRDPNLKEGATARVLPQDWEDQFYNTLRLAKRLSGDEQKKIQEHIQANKWMSKKDLKEAQSKVTKEIREEKLSEKKQAVRNFKWEGVDYFLEDGCYVKHAIDAKGNPHETPITNFTVDIREEVVEYSNIDDSKTENERVIKQRYILGTINVMGQKKPFRTVGEMWQKGSDSFFSYLMQQAGTDLIYSRSNYDAIRNCINYFSHKTKIIKNRTGDIGHYMLNRQHCYLMPSVIVTKDEIKNNEGSGGYEISFKDDICKNLDFKILNDEEFKDLAQHIIADYFRCNSQMATMTAFAHAMSSAMISHMPLKKGPVLWLGGNFSGGKSFIGEAAQCFFGDFQSVLGMSGSGKSKTGVADIFRDSLLTIDDYKQSLELRGGEETLLFIQNAYDRAGRSALNRDGTMREHSARARGNILITGEDIPMQEASALSRMIIVEINSSKEVDKERGGRVIERRKDYCGFTPHFIQFVYNIPQKSIEEIYKEYHNKLEEPIKGHYQIDGSHRIAENLASNMTAFKLAMDMLMTKGVIPQEQRDSLCQQHFKNLEIIRATICNYVGSQKGASVFLNTLKELLQNPSKYHIHGWPTFCPSDNKNSTRLGFWREEDKDIVYIMPQEARRAANQQLKENNNSLQGLHHIGRQLVNDGAIAADGYDKSESSFVKRVAGPEGGQSRFWAIRAEALGLNPNDHIDNKKPLRVVGSGSST